MRVLLNETDAHPSILDISELHRPEQIDNLCQKDINDYRVYDDENPLVENVKRIYYEMHTNQTVAFVKKQSKKWLKFNHMEATILEALDKLNDLVDESDPDLDIPNIVHAYQTAESIRETHPEHDWFQLVGLIHDLGKIMAFYEPQWAVVGDTFPVGCTPQKSVVFSEWSFKDNPDMNVSEYQTENGIYEGNCGIDNITMSWGHDEYLYQVLIANGTTLPKEGLDMIRYHSFYPWHTGGDYGNLMNYQDQLTMQWVKEFNKFDLYTKCTLVPDIENLKPYYQKLIDKYIPGLIKF